MIAKRLLLVIAIVLIATQACRQTDLGRIKVDFQDVSDQLEEHLVEDQWIDEDPESPKLLADQWQLAGEWVAAWLEAHPNDGAAGVKAALEDLAPAWVKDQPDKETYCLRLNPTTFLVIAPTPIGNVFIVSKTGGSYRALWSTAQPQEAAGKVADIVAAWLPENARHGDRGPYFASSGSAGSIIYPTVGLLPADAAGHARFYIEGLYAQSAGGTVGAQTTLWVWNGATAIPELARDYAVMIDQKVGARIEGDLFKVQEKKFFRTFYTGDTSEARQTDWIVRIAPNAMEDLGERSVVPDLDAIDELFYRIIKGQPADDIASPAAIKAGGTLVSDKRASEPENDWKVFPSLGMIIDKSISRNQNGETVCLDLDAGTNDFNLQWKDGHFYVADIAKVKGGRCPKEPAAD